MAYLAPAACAGQASRSHVQDEHTDLEASFSKRDTLRPGVPGACVRGPVSRMHSFRAPQLLVRAARPPAFPGASSPTRAEQKW